MSSVGMPAVRRTNPLLSLLTSGWPWGLLLTVVFYALLPYLPVYQAEAQRYFTAHWIEYATTGLFFVGIATLAIKAMALPHERSILTSDLLEGFNTEPASPVITAERLANHLKLVAKRSSHTWLVRRIQDLCTYIRSRQSADGLESQLSYFGDLSADRLHGSYALVRTITWAVPILGFLGTVIGITMAIANVTPDQLESSLTEVTAGLAVAFDTTALSLTLSMLLVFGNFLVEGAEQSLLEQVEDFATQRVLPLFPQTAETDARPLWKAEAAAADLLVQKTEALIAWQMQEWRQSLDGLKERWGQTLEKQLTTLDQALQQGMHATLSDHAASLLQTRQQLTTAFEQATQLWLTQVQQSAESWRQQQSQTMQVWQQSAQHIVEQWQQSSADQGARWETLNDRLADQVSVWSAELQQSQVVLTEQRQDVQQLATALLKLTEQEDQLVKLETRLAENLEAVRVAESLEETLLNLNAAIHLLSSKTRRAA
jgi:biopolymer transport protein ExbB/TolQ